MLAAACTAGTRTGAIVGMAVIVTFAVKMLVGVGMDMVVGMGMLVVVGMGHTVVGMLVGVGVLMGMVMFVVVMMHIVCSFSLFLYYSTKQSNVKA